MAATILLILSELAIVYIKRYKPESQKEDITTTITTKPIESTTTTQTTTTTSKKTTKKTTTKVVPVVKVSENEITAYLYQKVKEQGWTTSDYNAIVNIAIKESSLNPNSVNKKSGACGLFQAYPCNKAVKQYPDYMTNYKSQVDWGINYIKNRYQTPSKAWEFWQQHKWY